jgi:hypothetical protein
MYRKPLAILLSAALLWSGLVGSATAAVVGTAEAAALQAQQERLGSVQATLARADVQQAMVEMGVDPVQAQLRVAALNAQELAQLQGRIDAVPAGGILGLIGAVFVVLLLLEVTGVIDIFKKV